VEGVLFDSFEIESAFSGDGCRVLEVSNSSLPAISPGISWLFRF
jgi:hypothetical protein